MTADGVALQLRYTHFVIKKNLEGIGHEASLWSPESGGNSVNWVLGHILIHRNKIHRLVGLDPVWPELDDGSYRRGSDPLDPADPGVKRLEEMTAALDRSQEQLQEVLATVPDERLAEMQGDDPVGVLLYGLTFHEAYHAGQTGVLRRVAGREGALR